MKRTKAEVRARKERRRADRLLVRAAANVQVAADEMMKTKAANDFFRSLLTAGAFEAGRGGELPLTPIVQQLHPEMVA